LAGHRYYAAISLHNAAIAAAAAGEHKDAIRLCNRALDAYERLDVPASEQYSTHAVLAASWFELGESQRAEEHVAVGLGSGNERGDVPAEFALLYALIGDTARAETLLNSADELHEHGLSDLQGTTTATIARAFLAVDRDPTYSLELLTEIPKNRPLDVGDTLSLTALECLCKLNARRFAEAADEAAAAITKARTYEARSAEARLQLIYALAQQEPGQIAQAIAASRSVGHLALLQAANAVTEVLHLLTPVPPALVESMRCWPSRWLPLLRRALESGPGALGRAAASVLEEVGEFEDVGRLRAYERTYTRRTRKKSTAGRNLAKRVGPRLEIRDLGRVTIRIGDRQVQLSSSRRKPASLLMYLTTRPNLTAHRDEVLDALWPDADPASATNSLNQSLYFIRRDIDPWYEDDMSLDYIAFESDLVWLDPDLTNVASVAFLAQTRALQTVAHSTGAQRDLLLGYTGRFALEFEYDEWAIGWRTRLHAAFLELAHSTIDAAMQARDLQTALDLANHVLAVDPSASEMERRLVLIYWRMGARSSALTHFDRLVQQDRADGLDPPSLEELIGV
jgi:DNA-binding SARP family transcriptional activator